MAIISIPELISKGSSFDVTLDMSELLVEVSDPYFSVQANLYKVIITYSSTDAVDIENNQKKIISFDASIENPSALISFSATARDLFVVKKIKLVDQDGGSYDIPLKDIEKTSFNIDFSGGGGGGGGNYIDWTERESYTPQADGGITSTIANPDSSVGSLIYGDSSTRNPVVGSFSLVYKLNKSDFINQDQRFLGITDSGKATYTGFYKDVSTGPYNITFLRQNAPVGTFQVNAFTDPEVTELLLKMTITENGVEYFVNDTKITEFIVNGMFLSAGAMIPTARVYLGMEVLETYFE